MKKYIIRCADGNKLDGIAYGSRKEAGEALMDHLWDHNKGLDVGDDDYSSPFDFSLEEAECEDVNEIITDFESARKALDCEPNTDFTVVKRKHSGSVVQLKDVARLVRDINPKHIEALIALNKLFTIAQAWNKEDGFVPDFSDWRQEKWFSLFEYDEDVERFVYARTYDAASYADANFGSRLCFKSSARAAQFGKQFVDLYNKVFLID